MINIIFSALVIIAGLPLVINPKKVMERPNNKIKSETAIRVCGIILVVLGIINLFIKY